MVSNAIPTFRISNSGQLWLKLSVVYMLVGVAMGIFMGASENFTLRPVHAHVNLLGFTTLALSGLIYSVFPQAGESKLAKVQFWLMNLSFPVMMTALALLISGNRTVVPVLAATEITAACGVLAFAANVMLNLKKEG
ncbi:MAG: cytochrome-c oxidase [Gammaproteobacteria bacterium]